MTVQVLDKFGKAIARKDNIKSIEHMERWLDARFPHRDILGQTIEIFYN